MKTLADSYFEQICLERINRPSCQDRLIEVETFFFGLLDGYAQVPFAQSTNNKMQRFTIYLFL